MTSPRIDFDHSPDRHTALIAIHFGRVFLTPPRPYKTNPTRMRAREWWSTSHEITHAVAQALDEAVTAGAVNLPRSPAVSVRLTLAGYELLGVWEKEAREKGTLSLARTLNSRAREEEARRRGLRVRY